LLKTFVIKVEAITFEFFNNITFLDFDLHDFIYGLLCMSLIKMIKYFWMLL